MSICECCSYQCWWMCRYPRRWSRRWLDAYPKTWRLQRLRSVVLSPSWCSKNAHILPSDRVRPLLKKKKRMFFFLFVFVSVLLFFFSMHIYTYTYIHIYILHISHRHTAHHVSQLTKEELIDIPCLCDGMCFSLFLCLFSFFRWLFLTTDWIAHFPR